MIRSKRRVPTRKRLVQLLACSFPCPRDGTADRLAAEPVSLTQKYRVLVPSDRDVMMKIWHEGYLPWYYPGASSKPEAKSF